MDAPDGAPCSPDRFGPSLPDLPAATFDDGHYSALRLCADEEDWFRIPGAPGFPVSVRVRADAPVEVRLFDGPAAPAAREVGLDVELRARAVAAGLRLGVRAAQAGAVHYEVTVEVTQPMERCVDAFEPDGPDAPAPALAFLSRTQCDADVDWHRPPTDEAGVWTASVQQRTGRPLWAELWSHDGVEWLRGEHGETSAETEVQLRRFAWEPAALRLRVGGEGDEGLAVYEVRWRYEPLDATEVPMRVQLAGVDRPLGAEGFGASTPLPLARVRVDLLRADDGLLLDTVLTDGAGAARLRAHEATLGELRVVSEAASPLGPIRVGPEAETPYGYVVARGDPASLAGAHALPLEAPATAALHVAVTAAAGAAHTASLRAAPLPGPGPLFIRWQPGAAEGCGTCFRPGPRPVVDLSGALADPDEWDDSVILHEVGHFVAARLSRDDSPGGRHDGGRVDPRLAWSEGFASFHSAWSRGSPLQLDSKRTGVQIVDLETVEVPGGVGTEGGAASGALSEWLVAALLWDLHDRRAEDDDPLALDDGLLFGAFFDLAEHDGGVGAAGVDLADFLARLTCEGPPVEALDPVLDAFGYPFAGAEACGKPMPAFRVDRVGDALQIRALMEGTLEVQGVRRRVRAGQTWAAAVMGAPTWVGVSLDAPGRRHHLSVPWTEQAPGEALQWRRRAGAAEVQIRAR